MEVIRQGSDDVFERIPLIGCCFPAGTLGTRLRSPGE